MSSRQRFLEKLRDEAEKGLPKPEVEELLAEASSHLEDGVAGRIELGLESEAAERDAVAAFGDARMIAKRSIRRRLEPRDRMRIVVLVLFHLFVFSATIGFTVGSHPLVSGLLVIAGMISLAAFAGMATYARRPATLHVGALSVAASLVSLTLTSIVFLHAEAFGGSGLVFRWQGPSLAAYDERLIEERTADRARFDQLELAWAREEKVKGGFLTPYRVGDPNYGRIEFRVEPRQAVAAAGWIDLQSHYFERFSTDGLKGAHDGIETALTRPWANWFAFVRPATPHILVLSGLVSGVDLLFGTLGAAAFAVRRRRIRG